MGALSELNGVHTLERVGVVCVSEGPHSSLTWASKATHRSLFFFPFLEAHNAAVLRAFSIPLVELSRSSPGHTGRNAVEES